MFRQFLLGAALAAVSVGPVSAEVVKTTAGARSLPPEKRMHAIGLKAMLAGGPPAIMFSPIMDGGVLPRRLADPGPSEFNDTPILTGITADEGASAPTYGMSTAAALQATLAKTFV